MAEAGIKNAVYITKKLMAAFTLKDFQAVGFAANFMNESRCNPGAVNKQEQAGTFAGSSANGAGYGAGLAQWSNDWKRKIQKHFNKYTPIESWSMDEQIDIVIKCCASSFINLIRNASNAVESTDIVLRGYENGSGGYGTSLRSKKSMEAYTWAAKTYVPGVGVKQFANGYEGLITARSAFAKIILNAMGSFSDVDLASIGSLTGDYSGIGGGGTPPSPQELAKLIEQYRNAYPVHSEYETYSGGGGNIFSNANDNAFSVASLAQNREEDMTLFTNKAKVDAKEYKRTRIYSTNDSCIVLDELKIKFVNGKYVDIKEDESESFANQNVTQKDVDKAKAKLMKEQEAAKKKAEEEKKKAEEAAKASTTDSSTSTTSTETTTSTQSTTTSTSSTSSSSSSPKSSSSSTTSKSKGGWFSSMVSKYKTNQNNNNTNNNPGVTAPQSSVDQYLYLKPKTSYWSN